MSKRVLRTNQRTVNSLNAQLIDTFNNGTETISIQPAVNPQLSAPTNLGTEIKVNSPFLSFDEVSGADAYEIYIDGSKYYDTGLEPLVSNLTGTRWSMMNVIDKFTRSVIRLTGVVTYYGGTYNFNTINTTSTNNNDFLRFENTTNNTQLLTVMYNSDYYNGWGDYNNLVDLPTPMEEPYIYITGGDDITDPEVISYLQVIAKKNVNHTLSLTMETLSVSGFNGRLKVKLGTPPIDDSDYDYITPATMSIPTTINLDFINNIYIWGIDANCNLSYSADALPREGNHEQGSTFIGLDGNTYLAGASNSIVLTNRTRYGWSYDDPLHFLGRNNTVLYISGAVNNQ